MTTADQADKKLTFYVGLNLKSCVFLQLYRQ